MRSQRKMRMLQILLIIASNIITSLLSTEAFLWDDHMTIRPTDPIFVIGQDNITLVCSYNVSGSASNLYFERHDGEVVDNKYLTVLSPTKVKMEIPAVSTNQSGYYICILNGTLDVVAGTDIRVGSKPEPPKFFECVSENLDSMTCSWCPKNQEPQYVYWTLNWRVGSQTGNCSHQEKMDSCSCYLCGKLPKQSHPHFQRCSSSSSSPQFIRTATYNFTIQARNLFGIAESPFIIEPEKIVKPNRVEKIRSEETANKSAIKISWEAPTVSHFLSLKFNITYQGKWDQQSKATVVEKQNAVLQDLYPNTEYRVQIRAKPINGGYWSEPNELNFISPESAPLAGPSIVNYRRTACKSEHCFELIIYWKPPLEKNLGSPLTGYNITWNDSDGQAHSRLIPGNLSSYHLKNVAFEKTESHVLELRAVNSLGQSPSGRIDIPVFEGGDIPVKVEGVRMESPDGKKKKVPTATLR